MSIRIATHLYRNRHGTFYFRLVIPIDLRKFVGQSESRFSLHTERRQEAIIASLAIIANLPELIADLRSMADENTPAPSDYLQLWIAEKRKNINLISSIDHLKEMLVEAERQLAIANSSYQDHNHLQSTIAEETLRTENQELNTQLINAQAQLAQSIPLKRAQRVVKNSFVTGQLKGKRELEERLVFPPPPERTVHFSALKNAYLKSLHNRAEGGRKTPPTPKTHEDYERTLDLFIKIMGDIKIGEIDREVAGEYFSILRRLPANISRIARYKGKSIEELLAMGEPPQSESNCSKKIERVSTMFKWALEEKRKWGIDANPFIGFGQAERDEGTRRPFTHDELRAMLNHPQYEQRRFANSYAFWLIPLALYTGARIGELTQLDLKDFTVVEGIPCIDINDIDAVTQMDEGGRKKRVKTRNAKRLVPIHSELIRIGLLRYVEQMRKAGKTQHLFPELSRTRRDGPAQAASNWFGQFRKRVGVTTKQATVFHSFRHLFITNILDNGVSPYLLAPIVGHEAALITGQVYWNKKDVTKRKPTVEAFLLPDGLSQLLPTVDEVVFARPFRQPKKLPLDGAPSAV